MSYQVTARKWRPMVFEDVVGQSHVTSTLKNAIGTNRVAHAYIFSGTRGVGKTTTARILAKALNCLSPVDNNPDNLCDVCEAITSGRSLDVIEIDGASNRGVEEIRNLRESVRYTATGGKYKVYIIDEVHMLTKEAFNALLKTLEEPPPHVLFIFATTEVHKVPMTILSRCQRFDFRRIAIDEIIGRLRLIAGAEGVSIADDALLIIAKKGDGSLRDAQSIFDQVRSFCGNDIKTDDILRALNVVEQEIFFRISSLISSKDTRGGMDLVDQIVHSGYDLRELVGGMAEHFRNLLVVLTTGSAQLIETSELYRKKYEQESRNFSEEDILRLIKLTNDLDSSIRWAPQPRFRLEASLLQMIKLASSVKLDELLRQIDDLKKKLSSHNNAVSKATQEPSRVADPAASSSEVKVVGSVSAGRLNPASLVSAAMSYEDVRELREVTLVRGISVSPPSQRPQATVLYRANDAPNASLLKEAQPASSTEKLSYESVVLQWPHFVSDVLRTKIAVGTTLSKSELLDFRNGMVKIACPDEYHLSSLKRNKEFLVESFQRVTGMRVNIEPIIGATPVGERTSGPAGSSTPEAVQAPAGSDTEEHPVVKAIKRELGGELIQQP